MIFFHAMPVIICISVFITLLQTMEPSPLDDLAAAVAESTFEAIFFLEVFARFIVCPTRAAFACNAFNMIDIITVAPLILRAAIGFVMPISEGNPARNFFLCVVPVLRLLKTLRRFQTFQLLLNAFMSVLEALPVLLFTLLVLTLVFSSCIYLVEPRNNIPTYPAAMWLTIVTMTTVGYGDVTPSSTAGSLVVAVLVITSCLYMAMPLGIIGCAFTDAWNDRNKILLMHRTRDRLLQFGYTAADIKSLIMVFDKDGDGKLSLEDFKNFIMRLNLGFKDDHIVELFQVLDEDKGGSVDDEEIVRALFPGSYAALYVDPASCLEAPQAQDGIENAIVLDNGTNGTDSANVNPYRKNGTDHKHGTEADAQAPSGDDNKVLMGLPQNVLQSPPDPTQIRTLVWPPEETYSEMPLTIDQVKRN